MILDGWIETLASKMPLTSSSWIMVPILNLFLNTFVRLLSKKLMFLGLSFIVWMKNIMSWQISFKKILQRWLKEVANKNFPYLKHTDSIEMHYSEGKRHQEISFFKAGWISILSIWTKKHNCVKIIGNFQQGPH